MEVVSSHPIRMASDRVERCKDPQYNRNMNTMNSKEGYLSITSEQAYEWVKSGVWNLSTFQIWLDYVTREAELEARYGGC